ncbi:MAG: hypothetical protein SF069_03960 [Phycisphaerae bacterium]|nr:hypothetical protein [Phycisphaerae bacterium]
MIFLTAPECEAWLTTRRSSDDLAKRVDSHYALPPKGYQLYSLSLFLATEFHCQRPRLLQLTAWDIFPSNENHHLYYRLRQYYGDYREFSNAPGHLCQKHESEDLATFLQLTMLNGWDAWLYSEQGDFDVFVSHDEYLRVLTSSNELSHRLRSHMHR